MVSPTHTNVEAVFQDAKDKNVAMYVLYGQTTKLYTDAGFKTEAQHDEVLDALMRGALVYDATSGYSTVTSFKDDSGTLTVKVGSTTYSVPPQPEKEEEGMGED